MSGQCPICITAFHSQASTSVLLHIFIHCVVVTFLVLSLCLGPAFCFQLSYYVGGGLVIVVGLWKAFLFSSVTGHHLWTSSHYCVNAVSHPAKVTLVFRLLSIWVSCLSIASAWCWQDLLSLQILDYLGRSSDTDSPSPADYLISRSRFPIVTTWVGLHTIPFWVY